VRKFFVLVQALLMVCAGAAWLAGCPATTTVGLAPITAVSVPISSLLSDSNLGCGKGPNDVYKYAVVVAYADSPGYPPLTACPATPVAGGVFDCFAQATFGNLPLEEAGLMLEDSGGALPDGGSVTIWEWVAFYNYDTYEQVKDRLTKATSTDPGGADICNELPATWTTTCVATETDNSDSAPNCQTILLEPDASITDGGPPADAEPQETGKAPGDGSDG
jgi:hypothetical protein